MTDGEGNLDPGRVGRLAAVLASLNIGELLVLVAVLAQMNTGGGC